MFNSDALMQERTSQGLTQVELGEKTGLQSSMISMYENGQRSPSIENLVKLIDVLECEPSRLLETEQMDEERVVEIRGHFDIENK